MPGPDSGNDGSFRNRITACGSNFLMEPVHVCRGGGPVILAFPHAGTEVPAEVAARLNDEGRLLRDTD